MRKSLLTLLLALVATFATAQNAAFTKAVAKYKNVASLSANAVKTRHRASVAKDAVTKGQFFVKSPDKVLITFENGKDALLMNGTSFTMTIRGKKHTTDSRKNAQFKTFHAVLAGIFSGKGIDPAKYNDVKIEKKGSEIVLTITPVLDKKAARRQMFTSFVLTMDAATSELRTLRMNERKDGYTEYRFNSCRFGAPVADNLFK